MVPMVLLAEQLHCSVNNLSCFRAATAQEIVAAQQRVDQMVTSLQFLQFFEPWVPVIDNAIVRGQLLDIIHNTNFSLKPLMLGTVTEEGYGFLYTPNSKPMSLALYITGILAEFRQHAARVLERYPPTITNDQRPLFAKIITQWGFACPNRILARKTDAYLYVFGYPPDFGAWQFSPLCKGHVCHGDELPYLFGSAWSNFTNVGRRVSQSMSLFWTNFGSSQDPNQPISLPVSWPKAGADERYLYFQEPLEIRNSYLKDECDFWDTIGYKIA